MRLDELLRSCEWEWHEELRDGTRLPNYVYHYTSGQGLHGILSSGAMWGTNYTFMNDRSEVEYGMQLLNSMALQQRSFAAIPEVRIAVERLLQRLKGGHDDLYLTCFCEAPDLLSQWRGYGAQDSRYCIQFATRPLNKLTQPGFPIQPVIYDRERQGLLLQRCLEIHIERIRASQGVDSFELDDFARCMISCAFEVVTRFKNDAFLEEREWRCVLPHSTRDFSHVRFAPSGGGMRPYRILIEGTASQLLPITQVIAGASRSETPAIKSARLMLDRFGYDGVEVVPSRIPLHA